jgi:predicted membrane-bound spermidine synthase
MYITAGLAGACGMIIELVAVRIISPYYGSSYFIWTNLISIVLASLSAGYWFGGRIADRKNVLHTLITILFLLATFLFVTGVFHDHLLNLLSNIHISDIYLSILAIFILFAPITFLTGFVVPLTIKAETQTVRVVGTLSGRIYAISTIGSIFGTFLAGYILIPFIPLSKIILTTSFFIYIWSLLLYIIFINKKIYMILFFIILYILIFLLPKNNSRIILEDKNSLYGRIRIFQTADKRNGREAIMLVTEKSAIQSLKYIDGQESVFSPYIDIVYNDIKTCKPNSNVLMIGGGGYTLINPLLENSSIQVDVVEIDPLMTNLSARYFDLPINNDRLKIFHEDGRTYVSNTSKKYDVIVLDAFSGTTPPFHLTTEEFLQKTKQILQEDGFILINLVSAINGEKGKLFRSFYQTLDHVYPNRVLIQKNTDKNISTVQNIILLGSKNLPFSCNISELFYENFTQYNYSPTSKEIMLTDDFAPVEYYLRFFNFN